MLQRQRALLCLIKSLWARGLYTKTVADKHLFLLNKERDLGEKIKFYSFYPYRYGPFSNLFYYDMRKLTEGGYLLDERPTEEGLIEAAKLDAPLTQEIEQESDRFKTEKDLMEYVYAKYPEYTVKSRLLDNKRKNQPSEFFSIGYEGKDIDMFLDALIQKDIDLVIDVRHNAFSMQFAYIKNKLEEYLEKAGIGYLHIPDLGIPGEYRAKVKNREDTRNLFKDYDSQILTKQKLDEVISKGSGHRTALLCMEKDAADCHRGVISSRLAERGYAVTHL